jgi:hypothetical protein
MLLNPPELACPAVNEPCTKSFKAGERSPPGIFKHCSARWASHWSVNAAATEFISTQGRVGLFPFNQMARTQSTPGSATSRYDP